MDASTSDTSNSHTNETAPEIVFFDIETTVPKRGGPNQERKFWMLEFGAMILCPSKLVERESYCTLIRPEDLSVVPVTSSRIHGITRKAVAMAPTFDKVADRIYEILHGRIWAGHNIRRFDCPRIKDAFAEIGRPAPEPKGLIDSLDVLSTKFGKRAGDMKMATLANYFGLGLQKHRSLDDVRMNLEVLKSCATVLLLESSLPSTLIDDNWRNGASTITTRSTTRTRSMNVNNGSRSTSASYREESNSRKSPPTSTGYQRTVPYATRASLRKMTERVKNMLCRPQSSQSISNLLKHAHSILR